MPEYDAWCNMRRRCSDPKNKLWHRYGGRGISVCERWRTSFAAFIADVGRRPSERLTLDRYPNKDGNYEPGNVRWATAKEQSLNSIRPTLYTVGDVTDSVAGWAKRRGLSVGTLRSRLKRGGWPLERALSTDPGVYKRRPRLWDAERYAHLAESALKLAARETPGAKLLEETNP